MKIIPLTRGFETKIDDEDFEKVNQFKWYANKAPSNKWYAYGSVGEWKNKKRISLTRFILNPPKTLEIDHINGNSLDNRKSNLRLVSHAQNMMNKIMYKSNRCGFKGVKKDRNKWRAMIYVNKQAIHLGMFGNPEAASLAYQDAAKKFFGRFAYHG